jgi:hypothetical protein
MSISNGAMTTVLVWMTDDTGVPAQGAIHYALPGVRDQTLLARLDRIGIREYRSFAKLVAEETSEPVCLRVFDKRRVYFEEIIRPEDTSVEHFDRSRQSQHESH